MYLCRIAAPKSEHHSIQFLSPNICEVLLSYALKSSNLWLYSLNQSIGKLIAAHFYLVVNVDCAPNVLLKS